MSTINEKFEVITKGFDDAVDITSKIQNIISLNNIKSGIVNISTISSCTSIIKLESEPALKDDLAELLDSMIPLNKLYKHDTLWYEGNAYSHLKASILGNDVTLGVENSLLCLGQYQRIILIDFDNKSQKKEIIVSIAY